MMGSFDRLAGDYVPWYFLADGAMFEGDVVNQFVEAIRKLGLDISKLTWFGASHTNEERAGLAFLQVRLPNGDGGAYVLDVNRDSRGAVVWIHPHMLLTQDGGYKEPDAFAIAAMEACDESHSPLDTPPKNP